jgi:hypothetical protein
VSIQLGATATKANEVRKALQDNRDSQLGDLRRAEEEGDPGQQPTPGVRDELEDVLADAAIAGAEAIARKLKDYGSFQVTATAGQDPFDPNSLTGVSVSVNAIP